MAAYRRSAESLPHAFTAPARQPVDIAPSAPSRAQPVHLGATEALAHGWALAWARGQPYAVPEPLAEAQLAFTSAALSGG